MRKNISKMIAWLLVSGIVTTSSGIVALANNTMLIQENPLVTSNKEVAMEEVLYLTADMVSENGTIVVEEGEWQKIVIPKELQAKKIILKNVSVKELEMESGTDCVLEVKGSTIGNVVVSAPKIETMGQKEINELLASGKTSTEVAELYRTYQKEKATLESLVPTIVTDTETSIGTMKISANISLNLSKDNVGSIAVESVGNQSKMKVEIANYTGSISIKQEKEEKQGRNLLNVTLTDTVVTNLEMNGTGGGTCHIKEKGTSQVDTVELAGNSRVNFNIPIETVTVTETAENAFVKLYDDAKEVVVEGTKTEIMLSASAKVENAVVSGDNVKIYGQGKLESAEITGQQANVSTGGTKVEGENDKTVPPNIQAQMPTTTPSRPTATPTEKPNVPSTTPTPTEKPSVTPPIPTVPIGKPDGDTEIGTPGALATPTPQPTTPPSETPSVTPPAIPELEETSADYFEWEENEDGTINIIGVLDEEESLTCLVIPKEIDGKKVTAIYGVSGAYMAEQIVLPNTVITVEEGAFDGCDNLRELYVSESVEYFCGFPDEAYSLGNVIVIVSENNKTFASKDGALYSKDMTKLFYIPEEYEGVYQMPSTLVSMDADVLNYCINITEIIIPASFTMWTGCEGLESLEKITVEEGNSVYCSENNILFSKDKTKLVKIPANAIGKEYVIPETVKEIDEYAFSDCSSLYIVTISKNVSAVSQSETVGSATFEYEGQNYFKGCTSLHTIKVVEENENYISKDGILFTKDGSCLVAMPRKHYAVRDGYEPYIVPEDVTDIGCEAFYGMKNLMYIELPKGLKTIGIGAFQNCSSLSSITIPEEIRDIPSRVFSGCRELRSIEILGYIGYIGERAFYNCGLTTIENFEYVNYIGKGAFSRCDNLVSIEISAKVIGKDAFNGCKKLEKVYISEYTTTIEDGAFSACRNLRELYIPASVVYINGRITSSSRDLIIFAPFGSVAAEYAEKNRITCYFYN